MPIIIKKKKQLKAYKDYVSNIVDTYASLGINVYYPEIKYLEPLQARPDALALSRHSLIPVSEGGLYDKEFLDKDTNSFIPTLQQALPAILSYLVAQYKIVNELFTLTQVTNDAKDALFEVYTTTATEAEYVYDVKAGTVNYGRFIDTVFRYATWIAGPDSKVDADTVASVKAALEEFVNLDATIKGYFVDLVGELESDLMLDLSEAV